MSTLRLARVVALAAVVAACGDRPNPAPAGPAAEGAGAGGGPAPAVAAPSPGPSQTPPAAAPEAAQAAPATGAPQVAEGGAGPGTPSPTAQPAPAAPPGPGTQPPTAPAAPASVASVLREAVAIEPAGATVALAAGAEAVIDPGARFRVVLAVVSDDARLLLLDASDAVVAGEGAHELGQATRLTFAPSAPLVPGRRYTLRVDGAATRELHAASGASFTPASLKVLVAGAPPAPEPKEQPATRRKRRGR